jgi:hypothetical protein
VSPPQRHGRDRRRRHRESHFGRPARFLAWVILNLDQQGWEKVVADLARLHAFVLKEQQLAEERLEEPGGEPMAMVVALGAFETPVPDKEP